MDMSFSSWELLERYAMAFPRILARFVADMQYDGIVNDDFESGVAPRFVIAGSFLAGSKVITVVKVELWRGCWVREAFFPYGLSDLKRESAEPCLVHGSVWHPLRLATSSGLKVQVVGLAPVYGYGSKSMFWRRLFMMLALIFWHSLLSSVTPQQAAAPLLHSQILHLVPK